MMMIDAKLVYQDQELALSSVEGTEQEVGLDIRALRASTGAITLDPGFGNTGSCQSAITYIDGEKGILRYRGYALEDLAEHASFVSVCFLLLHGELPSASQAATFDQRIREKMSVAPELSHVLSGLPQGSHPMTVVSTLLAAYGAHASTEAEQDEEEAFITLMAQFRSLAALTYRHVAGLPFRQADTSLSFSGGFLEHMFGTDEKPYHVSSVIEQTMDLLFILHADHEQNCSTSTVRVVGSSGATLHQSLLAGVGALSGPLHGGANQAVIEMLEMIQADGGDYGKYLAKAKDKEDPFRLMGFGHRVYKNFDPRARLIKRLADEMLRELGINDPLLIIAQELEKAALSDAYFVSRKLFPNVDFYSGILYRAMGIPTDFFTVLFALGRLPGWMSHWVEMKHDPSTKITRPRQIYVGPSHRTIG